MANENDATTTEQDIPLTALSISKSNMRQVHDVDASLAASIAAAGLMYPITVMPTESGKYEVIDGARRLKAYEYAIAEGLIEGDTIRCKILVNGLGALEYSVHGNMHLSAHPLDEADAIARLAKKDQDRHTIAQHFGRTVTWVDQRAKLSALVPEVKKLFRDREIDLETAMAFTIADEKLQKQIVKARQYDNPALVRRMATTNKVNAKEAIFDIATWPADKIERDLFSEDVWLTSIPLFLKKQAEAFDGKIAEYKEKGYHDVVVIKPKDWETVQRYVAVEGRISKARLGTLSVLLQLTDDGKFRVWENMLPRKEAKKTKAGGAGKPDTVEQGETVAKKAKDLTAAQDEQLCTMASSALFMEIVEGQPKDDLLMFIVWSMMTRNQPELWTADSPVGRNTERRREALAVNVGLPSGVVQTNTPDGMSYEKWLTGRTAAARRQLYIEAVARMVSFPAQGIHQMAKTLPVKADRWLKLDEKFFGRYRSDQLLDYLKRSGIKTANLEDSKKSELVKHAVEAAKRKDAYRLGLG